MLATTSLVIVDLHSFWLNFKLRMTNSETRPYLCSVILSDDDGSKNNVKKNKCLQNNSSARTHVHHAFYISLTSLHDYHVKLPHATILNDEEFPFSFWTGKNHPRCLTNWTCLNAVKFKKRELFFLPTFSLPLSSRLLTKLPIFRGEKLTNPLLKLFFLSHLFPH